MLRLAVPAGSEGLSQQLAPGWERSVRCVRYAAAVSLGPGTVPQVRHARDGRDEQDGDGGRDEQERASGVTSQRALALPEPAAPARRRDAIPNACPSTPLAMPTVASLHRYPLKSAGGVAPDTARVERRGLAGDRRWMLVDTDGAFLSQRTHPRLALIGVEATSEGLRLSAPERPPLSVPTPDAAAERLPVEVWGDTVEAALAPAAAHAWCAAHLDAEVRLVYMPSESRRTVDADYAVRADDIVSFADGYPLLLTTTASLADLNTRLDAPLPMDRFRPNVVVSGAEAWAEDTWRRLRIGEVTFRAVKPCGRCAITTIDQQTATRGKEPLTTLARFRRDPTTGKVNFGWNLIPETQGTIRVGEAVEVLEKAPTPAQNQK